MLFTALFLQKQMLMCANNTSTAQLISHQINRAKDIKKLSVQGPRELVEAAVGGGVKGDQTCCH